MPLGREGTSWKCGRKHRSHVQIAHVWPSLALEALVHSGPCGDEEEMDWSYHYHGNHRCPETSGLYQVVREGPQLGWKDCPQPTQASKECLQSYLVGLVLLCGCPAFT